MSTKISIIIPIYNDEAYIEECLEAILRQHYDNYEIICVNDASTDSSLDVINRLEARNRSIKVINKKINEGITAARKSGVEIASGEYITFCDADDTLTESALQIMDKAVEQYPCADVIHLDLNVLTEQEGLDDAMIKAIGPENVNLSNTEILKYHFVTRKGATNIWGKIYKSEICRRAYKEMPVVQRMNMEDIYTTFYFDIQTEKYIGLSGSEYVIYNYYIDRGTSGAKVTTWESYKKYIRTNIALRNIRSCLQYRNIIENIEPISAGVSDRFVGGIFGHIQRLSYEKRKEGIELFVTEWEDLLDTTTLLEILSLFQNEIDNLNEQLLCLGEQLQIQKHTSNERIAKLERKVVRLKQSADKYNDENKKIKSSISWRITAPARKLHKLFR